MTDPAWWQEAVFYQIYPRSFADSNGDGIGDLQGITDHLDYLADLGIDALWLSPHYPSPLFDCGYDIANFCGVAPEYGTLDDFRSLLAAAHRLGIRVILDLVLNHTSHEHPWFLESRASRTNPKRDWYIWRDGRTPGEGGEPPNNWNSTFGGSSWEYDAATDQYYYHYFFKQQPDLNWHNPQVKEALFNAARFWLDLGVDGFRLDAIGTLFEDPNLPDHTATLSQMELFAALRFAQTPEEKQRVADEWKAMFGHQLDFPEVHAVMRDLRHVIDEYPDRVLVGEDDDVAYYGNGRDELHLVFNFPLMRTDHLTPAWVRANQQSRLSALPPGAWPCNTLGNHDSPRVFSHFADGQNDAAWARVCLALMLTLRGTPFLYNGEEIGMTDLLLTDIDQFRDTLGILLYRLTVVEIGLSPESALSHMAQVTRDRCRTPMHWANAANAGFSPPSARTWLPVNPNYAQGVNVAAQLADPASLLNFYRRLLRVRRQNRALVTGDYTPLCSDAEGYLAFLRHGRSPRQTCLVILNMSPESQTLRLDLDAKEAVLLFSSHPRAVSTDTLHHLALAPFEVYIAAVR